MVCGRTTVILLSVVTGFMGQATPLRAQAPAVPPAVVRTGWSFDRSNINWYDPKKAEEKKQKGILNELTGWAEYDVDILSNGWYELVLHGGVSGWSRDLFVDGTMVLRQVTAGPLDMLDKESYKDTNLYLTAGRHTLRFRRLNFPGVLPNSWELRLGTADPATCIHATVQGRNILRAGEKLTLAVTGGGTTTAATYELVAIDQLGGNETVVGRVEFPATDKPETRTVEIPCATEGVFELRAKVDGKLLRPNDFNAGSFVVIDVRTPPGLAGGKRTLVHDIDCVQQTDNGQTIKADEAFWDLTEPTRITTTKAGSYREGGDNTDPNLPYHEGLPSYRKFNSGFAYAIDVPEAQVPYLLEVEYPDDDRRTVNVFVAEPEKNMPCQLYTGYETGDWYELSNTLKTVQLVFWARGKTARAAILSKNPGMRAAASRVRVWRFDDAQLPAGPVTRADGRLLRQWMEEPTRWLQHAVPPAGLGEMAQDFVAIQRYCQLCRYHGFNAVQPTEAIYQGPSYYSDELEGWFVRSYDGMRIVALMCEKYGLRYIPELHLSGQAWFHSEVVEKLAADPKELYIWSRLGTSAYGGGGSWFSASWNPLHPAIQEKCIRIVGELADKVSDSPAFGGVSLRLMSWVWQGWNGLPSLNWGYGDWDIAQFEKDTQVNVPGDAADPERFQKRFEFLTSDANRERWVAWRCQRMTDYYRRLRDRIRKDRPDAVFYLPYFGDAKQGMDLTFGSYFGTPDGAVREIGVDLGLLAKEPGIAFYPFATYGRRDLGDIVADAATFDSLTAPAHKALGFGFERAFGLSNAYFEDQQQVPVAAMGLGLDGKERRSCGNNGCAEGAGRNILEKFAVPLADQDTGAFTQGGMAYNFGQTAEYYEFFSAYSRLPKLPFTALNAARDPVAVWYGEVQGFNVQGSEVGALNTPPATVNGERGTGNLYFYAVNREPYAVSVTLRLTGTDCVTPLTTDKAVQLQDGELRIDLQPFELVAYRAAKGTALTGATTTVPPERIQAVRDRLAWCQALLKELDGPRHGDLPDVDRDEFRRQVDTAWDALANGHVWRARTALATSRMVAVYNRLGLFPDQLLNRRQSVNVLRSRLAAGIAPAVPMLDGEALQKLAVAGSRTELADSATYAADWTGARVLNAVGGALELDLDVPVPGRYRLSLGHVAAKPGALMASLGGEGFAELAINPAANQPTRTVFPVRVLAAGKARLALRGQEPFGIYGVTLEPVYRPLPSPLWATIGPFPTEWRSGGKGSLVKAAMDRVDPPMTTFDLAASYPGADGKQLRWQFSDEIRGGVPHFEESAGVSFLFRANVQEREVCYGAAFITSPEDRDAQVLIGCDWWGNVWLNGVKLATDRDEKQVADDGSAFNGWRPLTAKVHLKKGVNTLLVKSHGGTVANWFTCQISDPGDLKAGAQP